VWAKLSGLKAKEQSTIHENVAWIHIPSAQVGPGKDFFFFFFCPGSQRVGHDRVTSLFISQNLFVETSSWRLGSNDPQPSAVTFEGLIKGY